MSLDKCSRISLLVYPLPHYIDETWFWMLRSKHCILSATEIPILPGQHFKLTTGFVQVCDTGCIFDISIVSTINLNVAGLHHSPKVRQNGSNNFFQQGSPWPIPRLLSKHRRQIQPTMNATNFLTQKCGGAIIHRVRRTQFLQCNLDHEHDHETGKSRLTFRM